MAFLSKATNLVDADTNGRDDVFITNNRLLQDNDLGVVVQPTSGSTTVGEYIRFRAQLTNTGSESLINCKAQIINPLINFQREFSFYSRPLNVPNPLLNGSIDFEPGESGQITLAVLPRKALRQEVKFEYFCNNSKAFTVPFENTVHLTVKT